MSQEITEEKSSLKIQRIIRLLYWLLVPLIVLTVGAAWWFYPEKFEFTNEYVSALGGIKSELGFSNLTSMYIFVIGFSVCGLITIANSVIYFINAQLEYNYLKAFLNLLVAMGMFAIAIPQDVPNLLIIHGIGAFLFIGLFAVLNFVTQLLRFLRKHKPKPEKRKFDFYADIVVVSIVFLAAFLLVIFFTLERTIINQTLRAIAITLQKSVLVIDCIALFFLDLDDM